MPKLIFINENAALIECEYVPLMSSGQLDEEVAEKNESTICRPRCGFWRDAAIRNQEIRNKSGGQRDFKLLCLHPTSPYLPRLKKKLEETGNI